MAYTVYYLLPIRLLNDIFSLWSYIILLDNLKNYNNNKQASKQVATAYNTSIMTYKDKSLDEVPRLSLEEGEHNRIKLQQLGIGGQ